MEITIESTLENVWKSLADQPDFVFFQLADPLIFSGEPPVLELDAECWH